MNRFSYLAAITAVQAASTGLKSNQLLLETGIAATKNIRSFSYSDVATQWKTISDASNTAAFEGKLAGTTGTGIMNSFNLVKDEYFIVEINQALDGLVYVIDGSTTGGTDADPIIVTGQFTTNLASSKTALLANQYHIDATNIFGATKTGFIKNYLYPAFLFKCTDGTDNNTVGFAAQGTVGTTKYYQAWKCAVKGNTGGRGSGVDADLMAHASLAELNADASNRLVASTTSDLAVTAAGVLAKATSVNPVTDVNGQKRADWLAAGMVDNHGKKLAGELFTVGANVNGMTTGGNIQSPVITVSPTAECLGTNASQLNFLTPYAKFVAGTTKSATVYDGRSYMVPATATPGQKYYSCLKVGQADPANAAAAKDMYTTVEVDITRPVFWQYGASVTNGNNAGSLFQSPGTTNAGLPSAGNEWGFPAITVVGSTGVKAWVKADMGTENTGGASPVQMAGDVTTKDSVTVAHWTGASTAGIKQYAANARAGEYLVYSFTATDNTKKLITNFWTGQAGMGRSSLPAETATFKHLELFSFAQPGASMTVGADVNAKPVVVLRVPEAAMKGDGTIKYYAGFQVSDDADHTSVKFYTTSLTVTVTARRFGSTALWKKSLVQPNFTAASNIKALAAPAAPRTSAGGNTAWLTADQGSLNSYWTNGAVTGAIPGQVVGFTLPDKCRIEAVLTKSGTDFIANADTPLLEERGSFQGAVTTGKPGAISFMVPVNAVHGVTTSQKYYGMLKIKNDATDQWLAVSVELASGAKSTGTTAILSDGLTTLNTGTAGAATETVTEATVKKGLAAGATGSWWLNTDYILTPTLELMDSAKAVIAFNANVGLTDTTATTGVTALTALRSAHIPADGFRTSASPTATEKGTWPVIEVQMPSTQVIDFDYTNKYLYRTYTMVLGGDGVTAGTTYYGAIRAKILSPEQWETKTAFDGALPFSAKTYEQFKVDTATTATAWTAGQAATAPAASSGTVWADNTATPAAGASKNNQITRDVQNGNSFVIAINHNLGTVTWQPTAVPAGKALERREELKCATFTAVAAGATDCIPSWSFRMPLAANTGDKYYAAFKAVVDTVSNGLAVGTYWVSIQGTVTAPIRHFATWSSLTSARTAVKWSFKNLDTQTKVDDANVITGAGTSTLMDSSVAATVDQGFNKQWKFAKTPATDVVAGWQEAASNLFTANVAAGAEACFDFSDWTATVSLETPAVASGGTAYTATTGSEPTIAAQVTTAQLANADVGIKAWCFTAPASGFGYVIVKTGSWYLPIKINTAGRERAFPTSTEFTADAGNRWSGSVHRVYNDLVKQWADTPAGATPKIDTNFLIDEVAVKKASDGSDAAAAVDVGAFAVIIKNRVTNPFTKCTEYAEASMEDTADSPKALPRPTKWLTNFGSVHSATDFSRVGNNDWAFSWQVPSDATAGDVYYLGLRCQAATAANGDYSAMWKVSITDAPTFTAKSADLKVAPGNQKKTYTLFEDATQGKWVGGTSTKPTIPDPRWDTITASLEVEAGNGFSVEINKADVTAEVVAEADLNDEYGKPLNLEARSLIQFGEVAKLTPSAAGPPVVAASWSTLPKATATEFPAYSWQVPSNAAVGEVHYAAVRAADAVGTKLYVALFEVVVKATPAPAPEVEEDESSGVMGAVITTALVTAAIAAALFFFVL